MVRSRTGCPKCSSGELSSVYLLTAADENRSDFIYMVPPFLAYYGVATQNRSLLEEAHTQISLYRNYLRDNSTGMWKHVLLGSADNDPGFWSTGVLFLATLPHLR